MVRETSREAYHNIEATIGPRQRTVYMLLFQKGAMTNNEIAEALQWRINTITPRVNELVKMDLVREAGRRACNVTGFKAIAWEATPRQDTLFESGI